MTEEIQKERMERKDFMRGHTPEEYAARYGVKLKTAKIYYNNAGIEWTRTQRVYKYKLEENAVRAFAVEHNTKQIAAHFNVTCKTVRRFMQKHGIEERRWSKTGKQHGKEKEMVVYLSQKYSDASIARLLKVSRQNIGQLLHKERTGSAGNRKNDTILWHVLEKEPLDLPPKRRVLKHTLDVSIPVLRETGAWVIYNYRHSIWQNTFNEEVEPPVAWCEIPTYIEEPER